MARDEGRTTDLEHKELNAQPCLEEEDETNRGKLTKKTRGGMKQACARTGNAGKVSMQWMRVRLPRRLGMDEP